MTTPQQRTRKPCAYFMGYITEMEWSSGWQPWYSLETLKLAFNVSSEYQGCHSDDHFVSVTVLCDWVYWNQELSSNQFGRHRCHNRLLYRQCFHRLSYRQPAVSPVTILGFQCTWYVNEKVIKDDWIGVIDNVKLVNRGSCQCDSLRGFHVVALTNFPFGSGNRLLKAHLCTQNHTPWDHNPIYHHEWPWPETDYSDMKQRSAR